MFLKCPPAYFCQLIYSKKVTYLSHIKECLAQLDNLYLSFFQKLVNLCTLSIFHPTEYLIKLSSIYRYELVKKWSACLRSYNDHFLTLGQFVSKNGKYRSIFDMPQKCEFISIVRRQMTWNDVARLNLMPQMSFWRNSTPFWCKASLWAMKTADFRKIQCSPIGNNLYDQ